MKATTLHRTALAVGLGASTALLAPTVPAGAAQFDWREGGCFHTGIIYNDAELGAFAQHSGNPGCSAGWVQLHYTDAKGENQVDTTSSPWGSSGGAIEASISRSNDRQPLPSSCETDSIVSRTSAPTTSAIERPGSGTTAVT